MEYSSFKVNVKQKNRLQHIVIGFVVAFILLFLRLAVLQIKQAPELKRRAKVEHFKMVPMPAPRGTIYDRAGRPLAISIPYYALYAEPRYLKDPPAAVAEKLAPILKESPVRLTSVLSSGKGFVWLERRLEFEDHKAIKALDIDGIGVQEAFYRYYPEGDVASHAVGLVDLDGKGLEGIEKQYDRILTGKNGKFRILRDAKGKFIPSYNEGDSPMPGKDVYLTIDLRIQRILEEEIQRIFGEYSAKAAVGVVLDADNGQILALTNRPTYNPNRPAEHPPDFRRNRSITDYFEPGSVFKMITAAAVLEENRVKPEDLFFCENGRYTIHGHTIHDAHPYGTLPFRMVIIKSSNIGTVKAALKLGEEKLYYYADAFGFGKKTGVDLPGEIPGLLRPVSKWSGFSITSVPFGQEVGGTALQSAAALACIVNGGLLYRPYIRINPEEKKTDPQRVISQKNAETLTAILGDVTGEEGTARWAAIPGYFVGGKTGTAQISVGGRYTHNYFASFAGFVKTRQRNLVIFITVDSPKGAYYGGVVAGPAFNRIGQRTLLVLGIPPDQNTENK